MKNIDIQESHQSYYRRRKIVANITQYKEEGIKEEVESNKKVLKNVAKTLVCVIMLQNQDVGLVKVFWEVETFMIQVYYQEEEEDMIWQLGVFHAQIQDLEEQLESSEKEEKEKNDYKVQILSNNSIHAPSVIQEMKWLKMELTKRTIGK